MPDHMELIVQDGCLWGLCLCHFPEGSPHVHHRQTVALALLGTQPLEELLHAGFRSVLAAEPDWATANEVTDYNSVGVPFANRYLVYADRLRSRRTGLRQHTTHVFLVEFLHRMPIKIEFLSNALDRCIAAAFSYVHSEAL